MLSGGYRFHIEFDDKGVAQLAAKIPDQNPSGKGTQAAIGPWGDRQHGGHARCELGGSSSHWPLELIHWPT